MSPIYQIEIVNVKMSSLITLWLSFIHISYMFTTICSTYPFFQFLLHMDRWMLTFELHRLDAALSRCIQVQNVQFFLLPSFVNCWTNFFGQIVHLSGNFVTKSIDQLLHKSQIVSISSVKLHHCDGDN